jgi:hypothetical protein
VQGARWCGGVSEQGQGEVWVSVLLITPWLEVPDTVASDWGGASSPRRLAVGFLPHQCWHAAVGVVIEKPLGLALPGVCLGGASAAQRWVVLVC